MALLKLLLYSSLIILGTTALSIDGNSNDDFDKEVLSLYIVLPENYNIWMRPFRKEGKLSFKGICNATIRIAGRTNDISLHAQRPHVRIHEPLTRLTQLPELHDIGSFRQDRALPNLQCHIPKNYTYLDEKHIATFHFGYELSPGRYKLDMTFTTTKYDDGLGFFRVYYTNKAKFPKVVIGTYFHPNHARRMFPCWDDPIFKTTFRISIRHSPLFMVLSNMRIRDIEEHGEHIMVTRFEVTPKMPAYLVAIVFHDAEDFSSIYESNTIIQYRKDLETHMSFAQDIFKNVTLRLKSEGYNSTLPKVHFVVIPKFLHETADNCGLAFYRETSIVYNKNTDPIGHKLNVARLIARGVVYQMLPAQIPSWSELWLKEGIAVLYGLHAVNEVLPKLHMLDLFVVRFRQESLLLDNDTCTIMTPLTLEINHTSQINLLFSFSYYIKAPVVLRMLQHAVTDTVFRNGINKYLKKTVPSSDVFWHSMQTALDESTLRHKFYIKEAMNFWTTTSRYPILQMTIYYNAISIKLTNFDRLNSQNIEIPVTYTSETDLNFNKTWSNNFWLRPKSSEDRLLIIVDSSGWIIINLQQSGYYRVNYTTENWLKLGRFLNSEENRTKIDVLNRAQIIDDAFYFLMSHQLHISTFFEVTKYLWRETDYVAWYPMIKALEQMSGFFPFEESAHVKQHLLEIFNKFYDRMYTDSSGADTYFMDSLAFPVKNDLSESLRQEIEKWACILNSTRYLGAAIRMLNLSLISEHQKSIPPWRKEWTYCKGLMKDKDGLLSSKVFYKYLENENRMLKFLTCPQSPNTIIFTYMKMIRPNIYNKLISAGDHVDIFYSLVARHANNDIILGSILSNFKEAVPKDISLAAALMIIINHVHLEKQINKITEFLNKLEEQFGNITDVFEYGRYKIETRLREIDKQKTYFQHLMPNSQFNV